MSITVGHLEATLGLNTLGLTAGLARAQAAMKRAGAAMQRIGRNMTMRLTLPLLAIGGASVKMAVDFEKSMSKIVGQVGIASEVVKEMSKDVLALAGPTARAPQELADALFFVTSAGLRGADAMDVLRLSARGAASGFGETKLVADLITSATNAYGIANLSAAEAMDTLAASVREGKAEAVDIAGAMGQVLPIASNLGVSFQEVGASIAAMSRTGTVARTAVIQLRQMLAAILKPSQQAEVAFDEMKTSSAQLREVLKGPNGLLNVLTFLRKEMKSDSQAMVKAFPNIRALSGALDIMGNNAEENIALWGRMADNTGDADKAFEAAAATVSFQFNVALAELKVEAIALGNTLMPIFKSIIESVRDGVRWFKNLSTASKKAGLIFAGVALAIGPVIFLIGSMITVISALITPVGLVVAGLVLLVGGLSAIAGASHKVTASIIKEQKELNSLVTAITGANVTEASRLRLIKQLQTKYPDFLKNIDAETITNEELAVALKKVNKQYKNKIVEAMKSEAINELTKQLIKTQLDELDIINELTEAETRGDHLRKLMISGTKSGIDNVAAGYIKLKGKLEENREEQDKLNQSIDKTTKAYNKLIGVVENLPDPGGGGKPAPDPGGGKKGKTPGGLGSGPITLLKKSILSLQTPWRAFKQAMADGVANPIESWGGHELPKIIEETRIATEAFGTAMQGALNEGIVSLGETLGNIFTGDAGASTFFDSIMLSIAGFMSAFGKAIIAAGIASKIFKELILKNPIAAIAAGAALVIASTVVKNVVSKRQGLRSGGFVTEGGAFQLHKDEIVNLPAGAAVTSQRASREGSSPIEIFGRLEGEVIYLSNKEYERRLGNTK